MAIEAFLQVPFQLFRSGAAVAAGQAGQQQQQQVNGCMACHAGHGYDPNSGSAR